MILPAACVPDQAELNPSDVGKADASARAAVAFYAAIDQRTLPGHS